MNQPWLKINKYVLTENFSRLLIDLRDLFYRKKIRVLFADSRRLKVDQSLKAKLFKSHIKVGLTGLEESVFLWWLNNRC